MYLVRVADRAIDLEKIYELDTKVKPANGEYRILYREVFSGVVEEQFISYETKEEAEKDLKYLDIALDDYLELKEKEDKDRKAKREVEVVDMPLTIKVGIWLLVVLHIAELFIR